MKGSLWRDSKCLKCSQGPHRKEKLHTIHHYTLATSLSNIYSLTSPDCTHYQGWKELQICVTLPAAREIWPMPEKQYMNWIPFSDGKTSTDQAEAENSQQQASKETNDSLFLTLQIGANYGCGQAVIYNLREMHLLPVPMTRTYRLYHCSCSIDSTELLKHRQIYRCSHHRTLYQKVGANWNK